MNVTSQRCGKQSHSSIEVQSEFPRTALGHNPHQFIDKKAVGLKEGSSAHAVGGFLSSVSKMVCAGHKHFFRVTGMFVCAENDYTGDFGHRRPPLLGPGSQGRPACLGAA